MSKGKHNRPVQGPPKWYYKMLEIIEASKKKQSRLQGLPGTLIPSTEITYKLRKAQGIVPEKQNEKNKNG